MTYQRQLFKKFWLSFLLLLCQGPAPSFATSIDGNPSSPATDLMVMEMTLRGPGDITNQEGHDLSSYCGTTQADSWIGTGRDLSQSYLALRFHGTPLPPRSRLQLVVANLQLTNNRNTQWTTTAFEVRAELSPTPAALDCTPAKAPASRLTTSEFASYQGNEKWFNHNPWPIEVTAPVAAWAAQGYQDAYGRVLPGAQVAHFRLGYQYVGVYVLVSSGEDDSRLAQFGRRALRATTNVAPTRVGQVAPGGRWQGWQTVLLGPAMPTLVGVAGWTVSTTHTYSPVSHDLWLGNGQRRGQVPELRGTIQTMWPTSRGRAVAVDSQGRLYFPNSDYQLSRFTPATAQVEVVAGSGQSGWNQPVVENVPATAVNLSWLSGIYLDANDYWYLVERLPTEQQRIRRVGPNGLIQTWAGGGTQLPSPSLEQLATQVTLPLGAVTVSATGEVYVAVSEGSWSIIYLVDATQRLRQVTTVLTYLSYLSSLAVTPAGDLYLVSRSTNWGFSSLYRITSRGQLVTVASTALTDQARLDGIGKESPTTLVEAVTATPTGELYFLYDTLSYQNYGYGSLNRKRVFRLEPDEQVITLAGGGEVSGNLGENGAATAAQLGAWTNSLAITPDGSVFLGETPNSPTSPSGRLRKIGPAFPGSTWGEFQLAAADGQALYHFTRDGRHLRTVDTTTGQDLYQFSYDANGYLIRLTDLDGDVTLIERDEQSVPKAILAPDGQRTTLTINANGYLETVTNPAGETYRLAYTEDGLLTQFTSPRGHTTTMQYDPLGRLIKEENPVGGGWTLASSQAGKLAETSLTSGEGRTSRYLIEMLNDRDLKRVHTAPDGTQSMETSWSNGTTLRTQADGTVITQKQGPDPRFGMLSPVLQELKITLPSGLTGTVTTKRESILGPAQDLSKPASLKTIVTVNGKSSTSVYTAAEKKVVTTSAAGRVTTELLEEKGRVSQTSVPTLESVHYTYDTRGRLTQVSQGQGEDLRTVTLTYDNSGEVSKLTDALGREVNFAYDAVGRILAQTLPDGRLILYSYDANGNVTSITPPSRPAHGFDYTAVDLQSLYLPPVLPTLAAPQTVYAYNLDKQLTQITRPDGQLVKFNYGASTGRLESLTTPLGTQTLSYDEKGRLVATTTPDNQTLSYAYDGSLPRSETWEGTIAGSLNLEYNNDFRVKSASVNGGSTVTYQYDADGLLAGAGEMNLSRDSATGLLLGTQLGNVTTQRTYNAFGELASETASYQGNALSQVQYARDKLGRIISKMETVDGVTTTLEYRYDLAGRLVEVKQDGVVTENYEYDANGNRVQALTSSQGMVTGSYDDQDRLVEYGGNTYTYTANGELLTKSSNGQTTTYHYDVLGNLRQVQLPAKTIEYVIDGRNRRVGKKVNGTLVQRFLYQGSLKPVAELDGNGNLVARFVYGSKGNVPDYLVKEGKTYRIISDHLGSPRWVVDDSDGSVVQRLEYDAFGNVTGDTNPNFQPFGFAGGLYDVDTQWVRFGARDYDAESGRWTSKDPIGFGGGDSNLFGYVLGEPVNWSDPSGLTKWDKLYNLPKQFWNWAHRQGGMDIRDLTKKEAEELHKEWERLGKPGPDHKRAHRRSRGEDGFIDPEMLLELFGAWGLAFMPTTMGCAELDCDQDDILDYKPVNDGTCP